MGKGDKFGRCGRTNSGKSSVGWHGRDFVIKEERQMPQEGGVRGAMATQNDGIVVKDFDGSGSEGNSAPGITELAHG